MKKITLILAAAALFCCASCAKERNCRCTTTEAEDPEETIINTDRSMKCSKITRLGFERQIEGHLQRSYETVSCEEVEE